MPNWNEWTLEVHAGKDFELNYTHSGTAILRGTVAWTDSPKTKYEKTHWIKVVAWGSKAEEVAAKEIKKGEGVRIKGQAYKEDDWTNRDGETVGGSLAIKVMSLQRLVKKGPKTWVPEDEHEGLGDAGDGSFDEDIPF